MSNTTPPKIWGGQLLIHQWYPSLLLVERQPLMLIIPLYCMLSREATNTNFIVFGLHRTQDLPNSREHISITPLMWALTLEIVKQGKCPECTGFSKLLCWTHYCVQQNIVSRLAFNIYSQVQHSLVDTMGHIVLHSM